MPRLTRAIALASAALLLASTAAVAATSAPTTSSVIVNPTEIVGPVVSHSAKQPPSAASCLAIYGTACYGPQDIHNQYDYGPLYAKGIDGTGQTIVIFDSFGSPTIKSDLATFDHDYGLADPPSFKIYEPEGNVAYNYTDAASPADYHNKNIGTEVGWAYETTLDVEWAHAMAPGASIALVVTPVAETENVQGLTNLVNAQQWALANHIGTIWSNSYAATEQSFNGTSSLLNLQTWYAQAATAGVSNFFASGDYGVANFDKQGSFYPYRTVNFPTSSPSVISVGGTEIPSMPLSISSYQPETVWNDYAASGGGFSSIIPEPGYQSAAGIADASGMRGVPDVAYNAAVVSAVNIYESFDPVYGAGWTPIAGTSAACPQWAAIDALANQKDGPLGFLTPRLYQIYSSSSYSKAFHDITSGNNSFAGITGYSAASGWDPSTGLGTPDVANLVIALASTK